MYIYQKAEVKEEGEGKGGGGEGRALHWMESDI